MAEIGAPKTGLMNIGEEAKPPFAVLPDPLQVFMYRAKRFAALAPKHELRPYLEFLARVCTAQYEAQSGLPDAERPSAAQLAQAREHVLPPLSRDTFHSNPAFEETMRAFLARVSGEGWPAASVAAALRIGEMSSEQRQGFITGVLSGVTPAESVAEHVLMAAALQIHFARAAHLLDAESLVPIADGVCPACGSGPVSSAVVGWPGAHNTRFCTCSLCATQWNVVRVKCVLCSSTEGISYHSVEGKPDTVKAETCDKCRSYVKILYQTKDASLEAVADDVASLSLDMLLSGEEPGWRRGGINAFLAGY